MVDCIECGYELHSDRELAGYDVCAECVGDDCNYCSSKAEYFVSDDRYCYQCYIESSKDRSEDERADYVMDDDRYWKSV